MAKSKDIKEQAVERADPEQSPEESTSESLEESDVEPEIEEAAEAVAAEESDARDETALMQYEQGGLERVSPLQHYLAGVRRYALLTREQEYELAVRLKERNDLDAAQQLVRSNLRLVVKIAMEYHRHWMDLLDLIQEGNIGLMQAVKHFDPYRDIRLSTYASFWIRAYILKFLMDNWRLVKIGTTQAQRKLFYNLKKEKDRLERFGFVPEPKLLAQNLDVKVSEVEDMDQRLSTRDESLDRPISDEDSPQREELLADKSKPVDEVMARQEFSSLVKTHLQNFRKTLTAAQNEKEAYIFDHRLLTEEPQTLQELGEKFNISRERIRQLESRLIKRIREYLKDKMPEFDDFEFLIR